MKPIEFPQQNAIYAKDQPEYLPLPAYKDEKETISCWRLNLVERIALLVTGKLWLRQMNFGEALQPQLPCATSPWAAHARREKP